MEKNTSNEKLFGGGVCPFCGKSNSFHATDKEMTGYKKYLSGEHNIQDVMLFLSKEKRKVLISGICIKCQETVFVDNEPNWDDTPEDIEYVFNKIGYVLGREHFGVVEFINDSKNLNIFLDYNIKQAVKMVKTDPTGLQNQNRNFEKMSVDEATILRKYNFEIEESTNGNDENDTESFIVVDL